MQPVGVTGDWDDPDMSSQVPLGKGALSTDLDNSTEWRQRYARRLGLIDAFVVIWATIGAQVIRFGPTGFDSTVRDSTTSYTLVTVVMALAWWLMLGAWGSRNIRILGHGPEEYKRVLTASLWLFGLIAIVSYSFNLDTARGYVGLALPAGVVGLLLARYLLRQYLHVERQRGKSISRVLVIGGPYSAEHLARSLKQQPLAGYVPAAAYLPGTPVGTQLSGDLHLPIIGHEQDADDILEAIKAFQPDAVALSGGVQLSPKAIRQLGWALADLRIHLIMAPALTDVAGPRIHTQPVAGLPLIHVSTPKLEGGKAFIKRSFDVIGSAVLILMLSPVLLLVALAVKLDSNGPVLFKQERIGMRGEPFKMLKFRSMVVDAEARLAKLQRQNEGHGVLFKMKDDPRITRVGKFIRRYSLDELPQLFNALAGSMSLVGPRPPLPSEVDAYEQHVHRRLLVKPGLTGLWQVSGRSLLSWEDTVRLDLYYVENWSLAGDIVILLRTVRAVLHRTGAY